MYLSKSRRGETNQFRRAYSIEQGNLEALGVEKQCFKPVVFASFTSTIIIYEA